MLAGVRQTQKMAGLMEQMVRGIVRLEIGIKEALILQKIL